MPRRISLRAELKHCAGSIISGAVNNFCFSVPILCIRFGRNGIRTGSLSDYHKYISFKLQEAGRLFIFEGGEVVSHRNLLVYQNEIPVSPDILNGSSRHLLGSFLQIQYSSWLELCRLCESFFSVYPGYYIWTGKEIELLELGDALWTTGYIRPLAKEKTKRLYFRALVRILQPSGSGRSLPSARGTRFEGASRYLSCLVTG